MRELNIEEINDNVFKKIGKEWMLVGAKDGSKANAMTASWGGLGVMWGKNVAFVFIRQTRYTKGLIDASGKLSLSFFDEKYKPMLGYMGKASGKDEDKIANAGLNMVEGYDLPVFEEAAMTLICKCLYSQKMNAESFLDKTCIDKWYGDNNYHTMYVVEIEKVLGK